MRNCQVTEKVEMKLWGCVVLSHKGCLVSVMWVSVPFDLHNRSLNWPTLRTSLRVWQTEGKRERESRARRIVGENTRTDQPPRSCSTLLQTPDRHQHLRARNNTQGLGTYQLMVGGWGIFSARSQATKQKVWPQIQMKVRIPAKSSVLLCS